MMEALEGLPGQILDSGPVNFITILLLSSVARQQEQVEAEDYMP